MAGFLSFANRVLKTRPGEYALLAWAAAYFYFLMASYYVMRPLRDELGTAGGVDDLKWLFSFSLLAMLILNPVYSWLVARFRREVFIPIVYLFFALNIVIFYQLFRTSSDQTLIYLGRTFYVWCAVFSLFVVSVFWSLMDDLLTSDQAKRLFGSIAVGGTLGAISGSAITRIFIASTDMQNFFLLAIVLLLLSVVCMLGLTWSVSKRQAREESSSRSSPASKVVGGGVWSGIGQVFRSRYLLGICGFILIYTITNTYVYLAKIQIGREMIERSNDCIAFFANIDLFANV
ncbi:MAG: MFS transporter, partial [Planctomycetes bacterium]|nr:MFS transporter [Planctomycetota bacterium]